MKNTIVNSGKKVDYEDAIESIEADQSRNIQNKTRTSSPKRKS